MGDDRLFDPVVLPHIGPDTPEYKRTCNVTLVLADRAGGLPPYVMHDAECESPSRCMRCGVKAARWGLERFAEHVEPLGSVWVATAAVSWWDDFGKLPGDDREQQRDAIRKKVKAAGGSGVAVDLWRGGDQPLVRWFVDRPIVYERWGRRALRFRDLTVRQARVLFRQSLTVGSWDGLATLGGWDFGSPWKSAGTARRLAKGGERRHVAVMTETARRVAREGLGVLGWQHGTLTLDGRDGDDVPADVWDHVSDTIHDVWRESFG